MTWEKPEFTEVRMDAEISMYILVYVRFIQEYDP